jgi:hypothetical protein
VVKVENDINGEISIRPIIEDMGYAAVLDIDGVCIIDSVALKIIDNFTIIAPKEDIEIIRNINTVDEAEQHKTWRVEQYRFPGEEKTNSLRGSYTYDPSRCKNDRMVFIQEVLILHFGDNSDYRKVRFRTRVTAERKTGFCVWIHYWTSLEAKDVSCSAKVLNGLTNSSLEGEIASFSFQSDGDQWTLQRTKDVIPYYFDPTGWIYYPSFTAAYGKASSRGVGNNWAVINH